MSGTNIDISLLPTPDVIETLDYEAILAQHKADLVSLLPECEPLLALESEPLVKQLRVSAWRELLLRQRVNEACRALLLPFAKGADLDHIGTTYHRTQRLLVSAGDATATPAVPAVWETDEDYLYRCTLAPSGFSVAGPSAAYEYHALSASGDVKNAYPHSLNPGSVDVYVLSNIGDGTPSAQLLATVNAALQPISIRPMCDEVITKPAIVKLYQITAIIYGYEGIVSDLAVIAAHNNAASYATEHHRINHSIFRAGIEASIKVSGVSDIEITSPAASIINVIGEAAYCTGINITYGGIRQ
jgi:phage-related baseplate assembly protein